MLGRPWTTNDVLIFKKRLYNEYQLLEQGNAGSCMPLAPTAVVHPGNATMILHEITKTKKPNLRFTPHRSRSSMILSAKELFTTQQLLEEGKLGTCMPSAPTAVVQTGNAWLQLSTTLPFSPAPKRRGARHTL
jgi:hypothetical protein